MVFAVAALEGCDNVGGKGQALWRVVIIFRKTQAR